MVDNPRQTQTASLKRTGFGLSKRHHLQCSPRPSAPDSPAHNGQHQEEAASSGHSYGKGILYPLPGVWNCSSGEMTPSKALYRDLITRAGQFTLQESLQRETPTVFTTGAAMRMLPKHTEEPQREPGCRRHPQHPHPTPKLELGKLRQHPRKSSGPIPPHHGQRAASTLQRTKAAVHGWHAASWERGAASCPESEGCDSHPPCHESPLPLRPHGSRCCRDNAGDARGLPRGSRPPSPPALAAGVGGCRRGWGSPTLSGWERGWIPSTRCSPRRSQHQEGERLGNSPSNNHKQAWGPGRVW